MPKFVEFNTNVRVSGKSFFKGDREIIDDIEFNQLKNLQRSGTPYVTLLEMPAREPAPVIEEKPKPKRRKKAVAKKPEHAVQE